MNKEKEKCKHKWLPNGIIKREVWSYDSGYGNRKYGEIVIASCVCEKCGEIKIKKEK